MKKTILHRSFKPAKCKTALKLASSRIKLLKNKRAAQVKVIKRELAQLLQSGQDRTARIRVEHVVMEEKIMTAYELIEIYCELIAARLPIIESQKNCPIDLKEAIASVIYASPRCADLPELMDVRKHFTAKYGKEFVMAALELRPNCGVSRMLAEKLSAKAPDGPTKMKILSGIAEEHSIKWDPYSSDEKELKPPVDLLNGPNTLENSTKMHMESPRIPNPNHFEKEPPSNCNPPGQHAKQDVNSNFHQQNSGFSPRSQNFAPHSDAFNATLHASHPESRPSVTTVEGIEYRYSHSGVMGEPPMPGPNWNMDFKDATAAAEAAAEAAERASMAARAAAELSSRGQSTTQYTMDSQSSCIHTKRGEVPQDSAGRKIQDEQASILSHHKQTASQHFMDSQSSFIHTRRGEVPQDFVDKNLLDEQASVLPQNKKTASLHSMDSQSSSIHSRRSVVPQDSMGRNLQDEQASVPSQHNQTSGQHFMESDFPSTGIIREVETQDYVDRKSQEEYPSEAQSKNRYGNRISGIQYKNSDEVEQDNLARVGARFHGDNSKTSRTSESALFKYHSTTGNDDSMSNPFWMEDSNASKNSLKPEKRKYVSDMQYSVKSGNLDTSIQQGIERQPSHVSYNLQSAYSSNDRDNMERSNQKFGDYSGDKSFVDFDHDEFQEREVGKEAYDNKSVVFDDSGSDIDGDYMHSLMGQSDHNAQYPTVPILSTGRAPLTHISETKSSGSTSKHINDSPKTSISGSQFSISPHLSPVSSDSSRSPSPANQSQLDDLPTIIFDGLDETSSEEEEELHKFKLSGSRSRRGGQAEGRKSGSTGTSFIKEENASSEGKLQFQSLSRNHEHDFYNESEETFYSGGSSSSGPTISKRHSNEVIGNSFNNAVLDTEHIQDSASESSNELNLGTLRGGLKHKNYKLPMYLRNCSGDSTVEQSVIRHVPESESSSSLLTVRTSDISRDTYQDPYIQRKNLTANRTTFSTNAVAEFDSDDDNPGEKISKKTSNITQKYSILKEESRVKKKSSPKTRLACTYLGSDSDESVEDLPKQSLASKGRLTSGLSRRTRASQTSKGIPSNATPEASLCSSVVESLHSPQSRNRSSNNIKMFEELSSANQAAASKPIPESKNSPDDGNLEPSEKERSASTMSRTASGSSEDSKTSVSEEKLSRNNSTSTPRHVHPKLPDFDSFVAHMKSLRTNRD